MARPTRRRHVSPRKQPTVPILFNVIFLTALLVGILLFKHVVGDRTAQFVGQFGTGEGTAEGTEVAASRVPIGVGVAATFVERALAHARTAADGAGLGTGTRP
jgi:hypothetical protein